MEGFGIDKLALILVIVLVLFGARRVPEIGASIGKGIREFKRGMKDLGDVGAAPSVESSTPPAATAENEAVTPEGPRRLLGS